jgi:hypothetical protein
MLGLLVLVLAAVVVIVAWAMGPPRDSRFLATALLLVILWAALPALGVQR